MASVPIKISKIGFCNFKFEDGQIPDGWEAPSDISNHYGIEFSFEYSWDGSNCYITNIQSEPIELDNTRTINRNIELQSIEFKNDKCLTIDFNSTSLVNSQSEFDTTIYENEPKIYLGENENLEYNVTNSSYMLANFKYENRTQSGNEEDGFSTVIYYIDIPNIKIPKPSKYENNVVFTEEGVKELVGEVESKVSKDGDTMTGPLKIANQEIGGAQTRLILQNSYINSNAQMILCYGNDADEGVAGRHGLYSLGYGPDENGLFHANEDDLQWMVYRRAKTGEVILNGNANTASKLAKPKKLKVNLASTEDITFDGSADQTFIPVDGILPVEHGGTGVDDLSKLGSELGLNPNDDNTRLFVKRSGDTMTGNLTVNSAVSQIIAKASTSNIAVSLSTSSDNKSHGVWTYGYSSNGTSLTSDGKWMICREGNGDIIINKNTTGNSTGNVSILGANLTVSGATALNNSLTVGSPSATKNTTLNGALTISGVTTLNGNLKISNNSKLILNAKIYGSSAPTARNDLSGEEGQIYFQLVN